MQQRGPLSVSILAVGLAVLHPGPDLRAQVTDRHFRNTTHLGIGYVTNVPNTFVGASAFAVTPKLFGGAGLYADVKFSVTSPAGDPEFAPGVTVAQAIGFGDFEYATKSAYLSADLAAVYAITRDFMVYGGAGVTQEDFYRHYYDDQATRGDQGFYWVADTANSGTRLRALGGVFFRLGRYVLFQVGAESEPLGATLGFSAAIPM